MKTILSALVLTSVVAAPALAVEPIKGSITYDGPSQSRLDNTPVGSVVQHRFSSQGGEYREIYIVGTDGRLELVTRSELSTS